MLHLATVGLLVFTLWLLKVIHRYEFHRDFMMLEKLISKPFLMYIPQSYKIFLTLWMKAFCSIRSFSRISYPRTNLILYSEIFYLLCHRDYSSILLSLDCYRRASARAHLVVDLLEAPIVLAHDDCLLSARANVDPEVVLSSEYPECATTCYHWI